MTATQSHRSLVQICVNVLDTYNPDSHAQETHVARHLDQYEDLDESERIFVTEVFSGCERYVNVLKVATNGFFVRDGKHVLRSEENLYRVFCYLCLFRLDELGMAHFRKLVRAQDINKMYKFLNFFLDEKNLKTWMKDEWSKLYETSFVQTTLLSPILRWLPELKEILKQMKDQISNKLKPKKKTISATETKPFNLTRPRPRSVPMPELIPKLNPSKPVPKTTYEKPTEENIIAKLREDHRRKAEENLMDASRQQFSCANAEKSQKTVERLEQIRLEEEAKLDFNCHKSHPVPSSILNDNIPIKLNAAAILREGKLYRKKEEEELKRLDSLQAGARDPSQFLDWQSKMRQKDMEQELAEIERRRLEGKLTHEEAILARSNLISENKVKVKQMKAEAAQMMKEYLDKRLKEEQEMKRLVESVAEGKENAQEAKRKLQEYKAKIVREVNEESQELMRVALEEAEQEMKQKMELIQQIRAMMAVPVVRHKFVNLANTAGHGLLSEMSIAELKERLSFMRISQADEEENRRDAILADKQAKDEMLLETLETISRHRKEQSKAAAIKFEKRKVTRTQKPQIQDEKLSELQRKLEEKRKERLREQEAARVTPDKKAQQRIRALSAAKRRGEQDRWKELEQTRERTAKLISQGINSSTAASRLALNNSALISY